MLALFVLAAIPPLASQTAALAHHLPQYLHALRDPHSALGRLNVRYHIQQRLTQLITSRGSAIAGGILGAGLALLSTVTSLVVLSVLTIYFLAGLPHIKMFLYRLAPQSRRTRVILLGDEIFTKVGGYLLGNVLTSVIAGAGTYLWMVCFGIPYPALLALTVALLDLIPVIGSTIGGATVTLVALTISLPVAWPDAGLLRGLPACRGLPPRAPHHGPDGPGASGRNCRVGPDRRYAAWLDRRSRRHSGRRGCPPAAAGSHVPPDG